MRLKLPKLKELQVTPRGALALAGGGKWVFMNYNRSFVPRNSTATLEFTANVFQRNPFMSFFISLSYTAQCNLMYQTPYIHH